MSYADDFSKQWKSLTDFIQSEMIKSCSQEGVIHAGNISTALKTEKNRWYTSGQYNSAWLDLLRKKQPEVAKQFDEELNKAAIMQEKPTEKPSAGKYVAPCAVSALAGFGIPKLIGLSAGIIIGCSIGLTALAAVVEMGLYRKQRDTALSAERAAYLGQLQQIGNRLRAICAKADQ